MSLTREPFPEERHRHAVLVATHPEDLVRGASGVLRRWRDSGSAVDVVIATESSMSLTVSGLSDVDVHCLGLPGSGLADHRTDLTDRLTPLLADADVCLVPWPDDPHPDRRTVGEVALAVAPITTHRWSYPIPESDDAEAVFRQPPPHTAPLSRFEELYNDEDPWGVATKWYERRKRATLLAALPHERYDTALEPACGTGILTRELAGRCDRVLASDPVPTAVRRCREHTADLSNVDVTAAALPDLAAERADLVVFSEILYYLGDDDLAASVDAAVDRLRPGGHLVAVHWLPWAAEAPRDGMAAHRYLLAHPALDQRVEHMDERFVLHVLGRR